VYFYIYFQRKPFLTLEIQIQESILCLWGFVIIKRDVARAYLENNTIAIAAGFIITASLNKEMSFRNPVCK
jgi:hypothetical protein